MRDARSNDAAHAVAARRVARTDAGLRPVRNADLASSSASRAFCGPPSRRPAMAAVGTYGDEVGARRAQAQAVQFVPMRDADRPRLEALGTGARPAVAASCRARAGRSARSDVDALRKRRRCRRCPTHRQASRSRQRSARRPATKTSSVMEWRSMRRRVRRSTLAPATAPRRGRRDGTLASLHATLPANLLGRIRDAAAARIAACLPDSTPAQAQPRMPIDGTRPGGAAAAYCARPSNALTFWRSTFFAPRARALRRRRARPRAGSLGPAPGPVVRVRRLGALVVRVRAVVGRPGHTLRRARRPRLGLLTLAICYVASPRARRLRTLSAHSSAGSRSGLARRRPGTLTARLGAGHAHWAPGVYTTWLVTVRPAGLACSGGSRRDSAMDTYGGGRGTRLRAGDPTRQARRCPRGVDRLSGVVAGAAACAIGAGRRLRGCRLASPCWRSALRGAPDRRRDREGRDGLSAAQLGGNRGVRSGPEIWRGALANATERP